MKTQTLLSALKLCRGAIENASIFPVFSHFCFCDSYVYSFNDVSAMMVPLDSGITAALRADTLLGVLPTLGEELVLKQTEGVVKITCGRTRIYLASLPSDAFLFDPPEPDWNVDIEVTEELMAGVARCAQTVGDDSQHREFSGVTFEVLRGDLTLYSSDDIRISRFLAGKCSTNTPTKKTWLLPAESCALFLDAWLSIKDIPSEKAKLYLGQEWALFSANNLLVYSKMLPEVPPDFTTTINKIAPQGLAWNKVPEELRAAVLRAEVLVAKDTTAGIRLSLEDGQLDVRLHEGNGIRYGAFEERIKIKSSASITLTLGITKLNQSIQGMEELVFSPRCLSLRKGSYTCWMAPFAEE